MAVESLATPSLDTNWENVLVRNRPCCVGSDLQAINDEVRNTEHERRIATEGFVATHVCAGAVERRNPLRLELCGLAVFAYRENGVFRHEFQLATLASLRAPPYWMGMRMIPPSVTPNLRVHMEPEVVLACIEAASVDSCLLYTSDAADE